HLAGWLIAPIHAKGRNAMHRAFGSTLLAATVAWGIAIQASAAEDKSKKEGTLVKIDGLQSRAPADWKEEQPPEKYRRMRHKQFRLPKAEGDKEDAEMIIYYFGAGGGGGLEANLTRWKDMYKPPE